MRKKPAYINMRAFFLGQTVMGVFDFMMSGADRNARFCVQKVPE